MLKNKRLSSLFCAGFILVVFIAGPLFGIQDFSSEFIFETKIPLKENAYGTLWGGGYVFRVVDSNFLFGAHAGGVLGEGAALKKGDEFYGMYKDDWNAGQEKPGEATDVFFSEFSLSAIFGYRVSRFFNRDQFLMASFSMLLDSESFSGGCEKIFLAGRYVTEISFYTGLLNLWGNEIYLRTGYSVTSFQDPLKSGFAQNAFIIRLGVEIPIKFREYVDTYKRSKDIKKDGEKKGGEKAVW